MVQTKYQWIQVSKNKRVFLNIIRRLDNVYFKYFQISSHNRTKIIHKKSNELEIYIQKLDEYFFNIYLKSKYHTYFYLHENRIIHSEIGNEHKVITIQNIYEKNYPKKNRNRL